MAFVTGLRFDGIQLAGAGTGAVPPGLVTTAAGGLATVSDDQAIRQALMLLLTTIPGERVMRPDYGCPLHRLVFAPNDPTTAGLAIHYVRQAVTRWEPRIEIRRLDAVNEPAAGRLAIALDYRVKRSNRAGRLDFALALDGEPA